MVSQWPGGGFLTLSHPVICVVGPTASGKTALAQALACAVDGEVVSADSMQIYTGMDIGTGKLLPEDRLVEHHGFDLVDPGQPYSAALFQTFARNAFSQIDARGKRVILAGGTGFYVRAAIDDYEFPEGEQVNNPVRDACLAYAQQQGSMALWEQLRHYDSESAAVIAPADTKRVARAFELYAEGLSYAEQRRKLATIPQAVPACFIGLSVDPGILRQRIDERVDQMVCDGLVDEVQELLGKGLREGITAPQAIGYKEIVSALDGEITLEEAVEQIKVATHRYAKRQRTWFRKDKRIQWLDADEFDLDRLLAEALEIVRGGDNSVLTSQPDKEDVCH